jgi:hypothetical protein
MVKKKKKKDNRMNLHEMFFGLWPSIAAIYEIGFIPKDNEYQEIPPEMYISCEEQGFDTSEKLYRIVPLYDNSELFSGSVGLLTENDVFKLKNAVDFLRKYAQKANCYSENSDEILAAAATILPPVFTEKSKFARS